MLLDFHPSKNNPLETPPPQTHYPMLLAVDEPFSFSTIPEVVLGGFLACVSTNLLALRFQM